MMEKRPVIGISPSRSDENQRLFLKETYCEAVFHAGGLPLVFPTTLTSEDALEALLDQVDGVLLSGGGDIHPRRYGEEMLPKCGTADETRDAFELALARKAIERHMPVLGICRGIQVLAVVLGGTLFQDLESQLGIPASAHKQEAPYDDYKHEVRLKEGGLIARVTGVETMLANSMHHQAIKDAGERLVIEGITMDGIIEAVSMVGSERVFGVEFHPEYLERFSDPAAKLFAYLIAQAKAYRAERQ